ncbi:hypothetical protein, partial [Rhizobium johnstonii]|uniref:hypothetical protein n=1 Tax=Rhizobium johnstonii TaxID=3019933 RepID=UPI003F9C3BB1
MRLIDHRVAGENLFLQPRAVARFLPFGVCAFRQAFAKHAPLSVDHLAAFTCATVADPIAHGCFHGFSQ